MSSSEDLQPKSAARSSSRTRKGSDTPEPTVKDGSGTEITALAKSNPSATPTKTRSTSQETPKKKQLSRVDQLKRDRRNPQGFRDPAYAAAMGAKGAAERERRRMEKLSTTREYMETVLLDKAVEAYDELISDRDPRGRRYRSQVARDVLDRALPQTKHVEVDIKAEVSALIAAFREA